MDVVSLNERAASPKAKILDQALETVNGRVMAGCAMDFLYLLALVD